MLNTSTLIKAIDITIADYKECVAECEYSVERFELLGMIQDLEIQKESIVRCVELLALHETALNDSLSILMREI